MNARIARRTYQRLTRRLEDLAAKTQSTKTAIDELYGQAFDAVLKGEATDSTTGVSKQIYTDIGSGVVMKCVTTILKGGMVMKEKDGKTWLEGECGGYLFKVPVED